jgi:hypothetical protein
MKNKWILIFYLLLTAFISCKKDHDPDSRDQIIGSYVCNYHYWTFSMDTTVGTVNYTGIDTIDVIKEGINELSVFNINFKLDSSLCFQKSNYESFHFFGICFFPQQDSLSIYKEIGGLAGGSRYKGFGKKIIN